jgi:hypothetical protein
MNNKLIGTMKRFFALIFLSVFVIGLQAETTLDYPKAIRYGELKCGQHYFLVEHPHFGDNEYIKGSADNDAEGLTDDSIVYVKESNGKDTLTISIGTETKIDIDSVKTKARIGGILRRESVVYDTKNVSVNLTLEEKGDYMSPDIGINTGVNFHNSGDNSKSKVFAGFHISSMLYPTISTDSTNISMNTGYKYTFSNGLYLSPEAVLKVDISKSFQLSPSASMTAGYDHTFSNGLYLSPKAVVGMDITRGFPLSRSVSMTAGYNHTFSSGLYLSPKAEVGMDITGGFKLSRSASMTAGYNHTFSSGLYLSPKAEVGMDITRGFPLSRSVSMTAGYNHTFSNGLYLSPKAEVGINSTKNGTENRYGNFGLEVGYKFHVN